MTTNSSRLLLLYLLVPKLWGTAAFVLPSNKEQVTKTDTSLRVTNGPVSRSTKSVMDGKLVNDSPPKGAFQSDVEGLQAVKDVWKTPRPVIVQGSSLKTWTFLSDYIGRVQVMMKTNGRPMSADVDLWHGPDNTPQKMAIYIEDGSTRPFNAVVETPGSYNAMVVRNTGNVEFPLSACVLADVDYEGGESSSGFSSVTERLVDSSPPKTVQGGSVHTFPFSHRVASVQILLQTDGRPLSARLELLQGPNNNKQIIEVYTEDGMSRPFFAIIETPGSGNVVRLINTSTMEFPLTARVEPYRIETIDDQAPLQGDEFFAVH